MEINLNVTPIDINQYYKFKDEILHDLDFGPSYKYLPKTRQILSKLDNFIDENTAGSLRNSIIKTYIINNIRKIQKNIKKISLDYRNGMSILDVSAKWKFPPLNILRSILIHEGGNESELFRVFSKNIEPEKYLVGHDYSQYIIAAAADGESAFDSELIAQIAKYNENQIVSYFVSKTEVVTEGQLASKQKAEHGRALFTPDILFEKPIIINGHTIHWIDYKDYAGCPDTYLYKSNVAQAEKYNSVFGSGAIMYHYGYVDMKIPSTVLLDARSLDVKLFG